MSSSLVAYLLATLFVPNTVNRQVKSAPYGYLYLYSAMSKHSGGTILNYLDQFFSLLLSVRYSSLCSDVIVSLQ